MRFCLPIAVWIADGRAFHGKNAPSWFDGVAEGLRL
jgi:hypothetical protein